MRMNRNRKVLVVEAEGMYDTSIGGFYIDRSQLLITWQGGSPRTCIPNTTLPN